MIYSQYLKKAHLFALIGLLLLWAETANAIQITEIMYNPKDDNPSDEFVELYNETAARRDLGGWRFTNGIDFIFPEGTIIEPRSYFVIARSPDGLKRKHSIDVPVFGPFKGALSNQKGRITLVNLAEGVIADAAYDSGGRWPVASDGTGHSLSKSRPRLNTDQPENWRASLQIGGTPGEDNGLEAADQFPPIAINEIFLSEDQQFIEIYNRLSEPFDLSGYWASNLPGKLKTHKIPAETVVPPHGYKTLSVSELNLKAEGDRIFIATPEGTRVIEACSSKESSEISSGRYPDGSDEWYVMSPSPDQANTVKLNPDVVINEIMYHPPSESDDDEYIELYNRGETPVDLSGWSITGGISFKFPPDAAISPDSYLVIARAKAHLTTKYSLDPDRVLGDFGGRLSNGDEAIRLRDKLGNKVDEVHYYDGGHWAKYADGYGSSLELIDPYQDNSNYQAWMPSDEARKAKWTQIIYSGVCKSGWSNSREFHCHLLGAGEMLIDDIRLTAPKKSLLSRLTNPESGNISNGSFEDGLRGWERLGNHVRSRIVNIGSRDGKKCLKIVASGTGSTGPNHIETPLRTPLRRNETYTISFWAKWQGGNNLLVTRCLDNQLPETHRIPIPKLNGTPGKRNSVYRPNLGPVFRDVRHAPVVPGPTDTVSVTARAHDTDGIGSVTLHYKPDDASYYQSTKMYDDGKHNDGAAGDGIYGGAIPPNRARQTVAFCIKGLDEKNRPGTWPRDLRAPGLYRIENKTMKSKLPTYRIIMTAKDTRELSQRVSLSNEPLNATFIFNERDVYYQITCRYTGSPHRRGRRSFSGYKLSFNADEKLHGVKRQARFDRNDNSPRGYYNERISYDLLRKMGVPTCEQEWIRVRFNSRGSNLIWEHILPPSKRYISIFYPDGADGQLYEIFERFTFHGRPQETGNFRTSGASFTWLGTDDKDQYRWNYLPRNHEREDDFTNVVELARAMGTRSNKKYKAAVEQVMDVDEWLKVIAVRVVVSDWDFLGTNAGKNSYIYRPSDTEKWELLSWDNEWGFQQTHLSIWAGTQSIRRLQTRYQHLYLSYIQEIMDKYFNVPYLKPWFEHYNDVVNGVHPQQMASFVRSRRNYLNSVIPKAKVRITNQTKVDSSTIQLKGTAPVQTRTIRVAGKEMEPNWSDATHWKLTIPDVKNGDLTLEFLDYDKKLIGKASIKGK